MVIKRVIYLLGLMYILVSLSGCIEMENEYYLNVDGSGKVEHHIILTPNDLQNPANPYNTSYPSLPREPKKRKKYITDKLISHTKGVSEWKINRWKWQEDGRLSIEATGYFSNIENVKFYNNNTIFDCLPVYYVVSKDNSFSFRLAQQPEPLDQSSNPAEYSEQEMKQMVKMIRARLKMVHQMVQPWNRVRIENIYHLPGHVTENNGFVKRSDSVVKQTFTHKKILQAVDELHNNKEILRRAIRHNLRVFDKSDWLDTLVGWKLKSELYRHHVSGRQKNQSVEYQKVLTSSDAAAERVNQLEGRLYSSENKTAFAPSYSHLELQPEFESFLGENILENEEYKNKKEMNQRKGVKIKEISVCYLDDHKILMAGRLRLVPGTRVVLRATFDKKVDDLVDTTNAKEIHFFSNYQLEFVDGFIDRYRTVSGLASPSRYWEVHFKSDRLPPKTLKGIKRLKGQITGKSAKQEESLSDLLFNLKDIPFHQKN